MDRENEIVDKVHSHLTWKFVVSFTSHCSKLVSQSYHSHERLRTIPRETIVFYPIAVGVRIVLAREGNHAFVSDLHHVLRIV